MSDASAKIEKVLASVPAPSFSAEYMEYAYPGAHAWIREALAALAAARAELRPRAAADYHAIILQNDNGY